MFYLWVCGPLVFSFHELCAVIADKNTAILGSTSIITPLNYHKVTITMQVMNVFLT